MMLQGALQETTGVDPLQMAGLKWKFGAATEPLLGAIPVGPMLEGPVPSGAVPGPEIAAAETTLVDSDPLETVVEGRVTELFP